MPKKSDSLNEINFYDDENHFYEDFWKTRKYEHFSEVLAINKLLKNKHFKTAMDFGGGYGRLSDTLLKFSDQVILVDPSKKQLDIAKKKFESKGQKIKYVLLDKKDYVPSEDNSLDLLIMVRVSHHIIDPTKLFKDIFRAVKPGGYIIVEVASNAHFLNRMKLLAKLKTPSKTPVKVGSVANGIKDTTPFVNHNPTTIIKQLEESGFKFISKLSVSNYRSTYLKNKFDTEKLVKLEKLSQKSLSYVNFGPSIFILLKKD